MSNFKVVFKNKSLVNIGVAESVSGIGDWITMLAVFSLLVFRGGGNVGQTSAVFLCGLVPTLIFSPLAGSLCDRFDRKKLMILSQVLSGLVVSGLIFTDNLILIYALLALQATSMSIMTPARQSSIPQLVQPEELTSANAFLQQLSSLVKIFAPMLAGLILTLVSPHTAIILDVISFALSALLLTRLQSLPPNKTEENKPEPKERSKIRQMLHGKLLTGSAWRILRDSASLKLLFIAGFFSVFVIVGFDVLAAVFFRDVLQENESFYGLAIGLVGVGSLLSTILLMLKKKSHKAWWEVALGIALLSLIPLSLSIISSLSNIMLSRVVTLGACFVGGIGNGFLNVQVSTLLQSFTPSGFLGKTSGFLQSTMVTGQLLGTILTPILVPGILSTALFCLISFLALGLLVIVLILQLVRSPEKFSLPA